jgi:hypothetical protein
MNYEGVSYLDLTGNPVAPENPQIEINKQNIAINTDEIAINNDKIASNKASIITNTNGIANNKMDIDTNTNNVRALETFGLLQLLSNSNSSESRGRTTLGRIPSLRPLYTSGYTASDANLNIILGFKIRTISDAPNLQAVGLQYVKEADSIQSQVFQIKAYVSFDKKTIPVRANIWFESSH